MAPTHLFNSDHGHIVLLTTVELRDLGTGVTGGEFHPVAGGGLGRHQVYFGSFICFPGEGGHFQLTVESRLKVVRDAWSCTREATVSIDQNDADFLSAIIHC